MTLNTEVHKPDHLVTADQLSVSSPRMRPRLGTTVGKGYVKSQISLPVTTRINQTRDQSCTTHPKINLQHVTQRRRERIVDWPQFRLRRKITGSLTFDTDCGSADTKSELSATRQPIRALHSGVLFNSTTCSVDHIGPVAKVTEQTTAWLQVANVPSTLNAVSPVTNAHGRRGISTNPLVRRRFSADGMPIHRDAEDTIAPSPAKRIYLVPGSTTMQHGNAVVKDNLFASRDSLNLTDSMTLPGDCGTTDYAHIVDATRKDTSRFQPSQNSRGRHSVNGPVERATKSETHLFSATKSTRGRKSHLLNGLRQSARQTLDILCKAWRNSTTNLTEMTKSISTETVGETMTTSTRRRHSDMSLNRLISFESSASMGLPELIDGKFAPPTRACTRTHLTTKLVQLRRTTLQDPFGIFVTKSDLGFRLTRLAENLSVQCPSLRELRVGDELIQVNGVQCARLSLTELSQHFSNCLTLLLTVRSNSEEFPMD